MTDQHKDTPVDLTFHDGMLWVTLQDRRVIGTPLERFAWLEQATPEQRQQYELHAFSIYWPELDDGIDIDALITGNWARKRTP